MEWYQIVIGIVVGLICLTILIILHELGHAFMARQNGVDVEEFGIGMPPRAKILGVYKGTKITLNWLLPLGGFCNLKGDGNDSSDKKGTFGAAKYFSKTKILLSGIVVNFLTAVVIFSVMAAAGMPQIMENQFTVPIDTKVFATPTVISTVASDSPAEKAGLKPGDILLSVAGRELNQENKLTTVTSDNKGKEVEIVYKRDGVENTINVKLRDSGAGFLGVSASQSEYTRSTWSAPIVGLVNSFQFTWLTLQGLGDLVVNFVGGIIGSLSFDDATREAAHENLGAAGDSVSGPVGIIGVIFPSAAAAGVGQVFFLMGIISLALAIMNLLPIPGLDGGRWLLITIFKILKKPLSLELEGKINGIGMMCLIGLIILITVADVMKLW